MNNNVTCLALVAWASFLLVKDKVVQRERTSRPWLYGKPSPFFFFPLPYEAKTFPSVPLGKWKLIFSLEAGLSSQFVLTLAALRVTCTYRSSLRWTPENENIGKQLSIKYIFRLILLDSSFHTVS